MGVQSEGNWKDGQGPHRRALNAVLRSPVNCPPQDPDFLEGQPHQRVSCLEFPNSGLASDRAVLLVFLNHWIVHFFIFWPCHAACRILVPQPGIQPAPAVLEVQSLN